MAVAQLRTSSHEGSRDLQRPQQRLSHGVEHVWRQRKPGGVQRGRFSHPSFHVEASPGAGRRWGKAWQLGRRRRSVKDLVYGGDRRAGSRPGGQ